MKCKMCSQERDLIDAHIIPKSFYKSMRQQKTPIIMSSAVDEYNRRVRIGIYDNSIVCAECEKRFQEWDDYAASLLLSNFRKTGIMYDNYGQELVYRIEGVDYKKLKLFFISVLWRASVSSHYFFSDVKLRDSQEDKLKRMIISSNAGDEDIFSVLLFKFNRSEAEWFLRAPYKTKYDGIKYIRFNLGGYIALIKIDKRSVHPRLRAIMLKPDEFLWVTIGEFYDSNELEVGLGLLKSQQNT